MKSHYLLKLLTAVAVFSAVSFSQTFSGRVGGSSDGNQHDRDDIGASAWSIGIFAKAGANLVHVDYANHLADNNTSMEHDVEASVQGSAQRWYGTTGKCYNDQHNLSGAISNIAAQINASTSTSRFYFLCAGPMEVAWRGINASTSSKRAYCTAISHSSWNDAHTSSQMTHTWSSIQSSGVVADHIGDQNDNLNNKTAGAWDWAKNSSDEKLRFMWERMNDGVYGDISDAGMAWYVITGLGDENCTGTTLKNFFGSGPSNPPPACSFASPSNGQNFAAPASISVTVNASDNGSVSKVDLYKNNVLVRTESTTPYQWNNTNQDAALQNLAAGSYTLKAIATDNQGATTTSTITITVGSGGSSTQIEAESYSSMSGVQKETCSEGGQDVGYINNGDYIVFNNVNFGTGATKFEARVASGSSGGSIEVRLDGISGTLVGTCAVSGTGGWQNWTTKSCAISGASGTHNLYLKFTGGSGYLFNVNWVILSAALGKYADQMESVIMAPKTYVLKVSTIGQGKISFTLPEAGDYSISVYNMAGAKVVNGISGFGSTGLNTISVNQSFLSNQAYIIKLRLGKNVSIQKMMLSK